MAVPALRVVKPFNVIKAVLVCLLAGRIDLSFDVFALE